VFGLLLVFSFFAAFMGMLKMDVIIETPAAMVERVDKFRNLNKLAFPIALNQRSQNSEMSTDKSDENRFVHALR
jgi:hypothetical protein